MSRLPTSQEIYDRIRWDPDLDGNRFTIGYEDRELGMQELPFPDFVAHGDIPWHRIKYFRCGDIIIWDRHTRIDRLASVRRSSTPF